MPNTIAIEDWLRVIDEEYLSTFVRDGGASVKFAVTPDESRDDLYTKVRARCLDLDHFIVQFNSATDRAHMPQDFFFSLARQVDWRLLARRMILRLAAKSSPHTGGVDSQGNGQCLWSYRSRPTGLDTVSVDRFEANIQTSVYKNTEMAKDFRVCHDSTLPMKRNTQDSKSTPVSRCLDWLTVTTTELAASGLSPSTRVSTATRPGTSSNRPSTGSDTWATPDSDTV